MKETEKDLSSRYYAAETACWLLGGVLLVSRYLGVAPDQPLPLLNVTPASARHYVGTVAALLVVTLLYLLVEWIQSSRSARSAPYRFVRLMAAICYTVGALWLSHVVLSQGTRLAGISPAWYLAFAAIGVLLGSLVAALAFSALMIRNPEESKRLGLPRIPAATRAQFLAWSPAIVLLLLAYYILVRFSPSQIHSLSVYLVSIPLVLMVLAECMSLSLARDENGERISFIKRLARFKEIHDSHDYAYLLADQGVRRVKELGLDPSSSPQELQKTMRKHFAKPAGWEPMGFHVQQEEEMQILFYPKDANPESSDPENCGVKIDKGGNKELLRVAVIPDDRTRETKTMAISVALVESYAEEYLSTPTKQKDRAFHKVFSYAINQAVIKGMADQVGPLLYAAANAGEIEAVNQLIQQKDIDINERAAFGWTALLAASAQGYPEIARQLLEAGANPDIGNVHGITPLMYGARYGNAEICSVLLEFEAAIDVQDIYGMTALMVATRNGQQTIVDLLIEASANTNVKTREGKTALDFAYAYKHGTIAKILKRANKCGRAMK